MHCPSCGHENLIGADACEQCGQDLSALNSHVPGSLLEHDIVAEPIRALLTEAPLTVELNTPLAEVVRLLANRNVGAVLVVHEDALLGIFSERDLLQKVGDRFESVADAPIRNFMTAKPETVSVDDPIVFALNKMDVGHFRHVPVVEKGVPVGLLRYLVTKYPDVLLAAPDA
jgi:CBS domain-containing protein